MDRQAHHNSKDFCQLATDAFGFGSAGDGWRSDRGGHCNLRARKRAARDIASHKLASYGIRQ